MLTATAIVRGLLRQDRRTRRALSLLIVTEIGIVTVTATEVGTGRGDADGRREAAGEGVGSDQRIVRSLFTSSFFLSLFRLGRFVVLFISCISSLRSYFSCLSFVVLLYNLIFRLRFCSTYSSALSSLVAYRTRVCVSVVWLTSKTVSLPFLITSVSLSFIS